MNTFKIQYYHKLLHQHQTNGIHGAAELYVDLHIISVLAKLLSSGIDTRPCHEPPLIYVFYAPN
jgi:hypothetical protein